MSDNIAFFVRVVKRLREKLDYALRDATKTSINFQTKYAGDAAHALEWGDEVFQAAAIQRLMTRNRSMLDTLIETAGTAETAAEEDAKYLTILKDFTRYVIRNAGDAARVARSSNQSENLLNHFMMVEATRLMMEMIDLMGEPYKS